MLKYLKFHQQIQFTGATTCSWCLFQDSIKMQRWFSMLVWILIFSGDALFGGLKFYFQNSTYYARQYPYYMAWSKCKHCHIVARWESLCSEFNPSLEILLLSLAGTSRAQINQVDIVCISSHLFSVLKKKKEKREKKFTILQIAIYNRGGIPQ